MAMALILFATAGKKMLSERASFLLTCAMQLTTAPIVKVKMTNLLWSETRFSNRQLCTCSVFEGFVHIQCTM